MEDNDNDTNSARPALLRNPDSGDVLTGSERNNFTGLVGDWARSLTANLSQHENDIPNYYLKDPFGLVTTSYVHSFQVGTGESIFEQTISRIENARFEVIFVTCFWAKSVSLEKLAKSLKALSSKSLRNNQGSSKIRVRIGLSSRSGCQKLLHTNSVDGHVYTTSEWTTKLGLPDPSELAGLDLEVKSVFVKPFSVMHPKFVIVDRQLVFLPSCNVSWENWFEGCLAMSGGIVGQFVQFWYKFWNQDRGGLPAIGSHTTEDVPAVALHRRLSVVQETPVWMSYLSNCIGVEIPTVFLPSPHHTNPKFQPIPGLKAPQPPSTPLNVFLEKLFERAQFEVYVQTPNLTCPLVLDALFAALARGVDVCILTSERLMVLEQLGTAGTTTSREMKKLVKKYTKLLKVSPVQDLERDGARNPAQLGRLSIKYFDAPADAKPKDPVQSHLKLTIVDEEFVVLGSGNMDRASWYTSQELGVAFWSTEVAAEIQRLIKANLVRSTKIFYPRS
ncbi:hypothetical protein IWX90DRAFT_118222 [Phyllosticta citrichinensis]|uniref:PLD phosphodiesterase domain-containing protein n=1 Tax=Phyllosticta citrichinensis TaxID=1130410 RepID=A0ABR1Y3K8_9PEZI